MLQVTVTMSVNVNFPGTVPKVQPSAALFRLPVPNHDMWLIKQVPANIITMYYFLCKLLNDPRVTTSRVSLSANIQSIRDSRYVSIC